MLRPLLPCPPPLANLCAPLYTHPDSLQGLNNPDAPAINYLTARARPPTTPCHKICGVCGLEGKYTCVVCGTRFCRKKCYAHHKETRYVGILMISQLCYFVIYTSSHNSVCDSVCVCCSVKDYYMLPLLMYHAFLCLL